MQLQEQMRQRVQADFQSRVAGIFSPAWQVAFEKAAAAQAAAEKAANDKPEKGK